MWWRYCNSVKMLTRLGRVQVSKYTSSKSSSAALRNGSYIDIHPKIRQSIENGEPVVGLESTIITHGMPFPDNLETAQAVEKLIIENGAMPATIAIINGRIKVGLSTGEMHHLSTLPTEKVIKCSRRDLPYALAQSQNGGTTVAATMIIANKVGINVFATGGIGGVHRDGHITMDISADLIELGRTPVAVVCSGIKSILDIPRTLEFLETQGVCVASYGRASSNFPDFYTRDSGYKVPCHVANPSEAAQLIKSWHNLSLNSGVLIGVPVPAEYEADKCLIDKAIATATNAAKNQGITGKEVTPFLLSAIAEITKGNSLAANIALIKNNAVVAAQIAVNLCGKKSTCSNAMQMPYPVVIGASILDLSLKMVRDEPIVLNGATYPAEMRHSAGGVGRNVAEGLHKLYGNVHFISAVGKDQFANNLLELMPEQLQRGVVIDETQATSLCCVLFDKSGDCKSVWGNMNIHNSITPEIIESNRNLFERAPLIIMDANICVETMASILSMAKEHNCPVFFEPTDMHIAGKPFTLPNELSNQISIISPNLHEFKTIAEVILKRSLPPVSLDSDTETIVRNAKHIIDLIGSHFSCIVLTLAHHGVLLKYTKSSDQLLHSLCDDFHSDCVHFYPAPSIEDIKNVSGAGDSFCCGFITGLLRRYNGPECVALGFAAAEQALKSDSAVPSKYFCCESQEKDLTRNILNSLKLKLKVIS